MNIPDMIITIIGPVQTRVLLTRAQHAPFVREWVLGTSINKETERFLYTVPVRFPDGTEGAIYSEHSGILNVQIGETHMITGSTLAVMNNAGPYHRFWETKP